jgi:hypothetical protein
MGGLGKMGRMGKRKNADDGLACLSQIMKIHVFAIASMSILDIQIFYGTLSI